MNKGFKVVCNICGCDKCEVVADVYEDFDYDYEDELESCGIVDNGLVFNCPECGQEYREDEDY